MWTRRTVVSIGCFLTLGVAMSPGLSLGQQPVWTWNRTYQIQRATAGLGGFVNLVYPWGDNDDSGWVTGGEADAEAIAERSESGQGWSASASGVSMASSAFCPDHQPVISWDFIHNRGITASVDNAGATGGTIPAGSAVKVEAVLWHYQNDNQATCDGVLGLELGWTSTYGAVRTIDMEITFGSASLDIYNDGENIVAVGTDGYGNECSESAVSGSITGSLAVSEFRSPLHHGSGATIHSRPPNESDPAWVASGHTLVVSGSDWDSSADLFSGAVGIMVDD